MQQVFVYKAQAKSDAWCGKIQFKMAQTGLPWLTAPIDIIRFAFTLRNWNIIDLLESGRNREIGAVHFFYLTGPRLGNKDM